MSFLNKIFGKSEAVHRKSRADNLIEVSNNWGIGDGTPLLVEATPNLVRIFSDPAPRIPQEITDKNRNYWEDEDIETKRYSLAIAYLQHPNPTVRKDTIKFVHNINSWGVLQVLVDLLADQDMLVRKAAAKSIWERQRSTNCEFAVHALRDEIRGHAQGLAGATKEGLTLGRDKALRALDLLVNESPDENARKAIQEMIERDVIIEERVKPVDISSVTFVGKELGQSGFGNERSTYEVYRASSKEQALAFLITKKVRKRFYYIEVETPEGNFGRDINGIYDI